MLQSRINKTDRDSCTMVTTCDFSILTTKIETIGFVREFCVSGSRPVCANLMDRKKRGGVTKASSREKDSTIGLHLSPLCIAIVGPIRKKMAKRWPRFSVSFYPLISTIIYETFNLFLIIEENNKHHTSNQ